MRPYLVLTLLLLGGPAAAQSLQESVTDVWVHDVPGPPQGDFWHPVSEHLLSAFTDPASIYPNVMVCARPLTVATPHCSSICWELKGDSHGNGQPSTECRRTLHVRLVTNDPRMLLEVVDMERAGDGARVHAIIARNIAVGDPSSCPHAHPCRLNLPQGINTARGTLALSFGTEVHGVLGSPAAPSSPTASGGGSATPANGTPAWQPALDWARNAARKWAQSKDPTANARETADRAAAATQAQINSCLSAVAHSDDKLRARMPACANTTGKPFEQCMYKSVLYDEPMALTQGYSCSRHYQEEVDTLGKAGAYVWLKSKVCGIGQWLGLKACQG
ncbi:MAG TPA: hypothetical protein VGG96_01885 [Steroidobacteraceae bacterium]|jgi:hypothetical protein